MRQRCQYCYQTNFNHIALIVMNINNTNLLTQIYFDKFKFYRDKNKSNIFERQETKYLYFRETEHIFDQK